MAVQLVCKGRTASAFAAHARQRSAATTARRAPRAAARAGQIAARIAGGVCRGCVCGGVALTGDAPACRWDQQCAAACRCCRAHCAAGRSRARLATRTAAAHSTTHARYTPPPPPPPHTHHIAPRLCRNAQDGDRARHGRCAGRAGRRRPPRAEHHPPHARRQAHGGGGARHAGARAHRCACVCVFCVCVCVCACVGVCVWASVCGRLCGLVCARAPLRVRGCRLLAVGAGGGSGVARAPHQPVQRPPC
jgi:hypothetical protein